MSSHQCGGRDETVEDQRLVVGLPVAHRDDDVAVLDPAVDAERGAHAERVPRTVRVPPTLGGVDAVRSRDAGERIRHPDRVAVENECVLVVQTSPAGEHLVARAELLGRRRSPELDEALVGQVAELEIVSIHVRPSLSGALPGQPPAGSVPT